MRLADAIDGWIEVHGGDLSDATRADIGAIGAAVGETGLDNLDHRDVDDAVGDELAEAADTSLSPKAIKVFLSTIVSWAGDQDDLGHDAAADDEDDVAAATTEADHQDLDVEDGNEDEEAADEDEDEDDEDDGDDDGDLDAASSATFADLIDNDDDEDDDDEEDDDDDDDDEEDDDDKDDDEEDDGTNDIDVELDDDDEPDPLGATSFLQAIEADPAETDAEVEPGPSVGALSDLADDGESGGAFTAAANQPKERSIDLIAVMYFAIAAICCAVVIYLWATS